MRFARALLLLGAVGCAGDVKADFEAICHATERSGAAGETDAAAKAVKTAQWLSGQLKTEQAKKFMARLAVLDAAKKGEALSAEAKRHGVSPCPIVAESWPPKP
jgi:hypothetical protein